MFSRRRWLTLVLLLGSAMMAISCKKSGEEFFGSGVAYYEAGKYQEALVEFRNATAIQPTSADFMYELGRTHLALNNVSAALAEFEGVLRLKQDHVGAQVQLATLYLVTQQDSKAKPIIDGALRVEPTNAAARSLRGQYLIRAGDIEGGKADLEESIRLGPSQVELYGALATFYAGRGFPEKAVEVLAQAAASNPSSVTATLNLAQALLSQGAIVEAEKATRKALSLDSRHLRANLFLAQMFAITNRLDEAEKVLRFVKATAPSDPVAYRALAVFYETTGQRDKAIEELRTLNAEQFRDLIVKQRLVENLLAAGGIDEAERINQSIKKATPESAHPIFTEGRIQVARQQPEAAIVSFNKAISMQSHADYLYALGMVQAALGLELPARESFQAVVTQDPNNLDAVLALAVFAFGGGDHRGAWQATDEVLRRYPASSEARVVRARMLMAAGQVSQAEALLEEVLSVKPGDLQALGLLVDIKVLQGSGDRIAGRIVSLLAKDPSIGELHLLLGIVRYARKDLVGGEQSLREAIRLKPSIKAAHQVLASILLERQQRAAAKEALQKAIMVDPRNMNNYVLLAAEYEKDGETGRALDSLSSAHAVDPTSWIVSNQYAYMLLQTGGDVNKALSLAQSAKERMPASADVADTLGWAYHKLGIHDQAIRQFVLAIRLNASEPEYHYHLAETYIALKRTDAAKAALKTSLTFPSWPARSKAEAALERLSR
jgi:cellulose synthase operon protein C